MANVIAAQKKKKEKLKQQTATDAAILRAVTRFNLHSGENSPGDHSPHLPDLMHARQLSERMRPTSRRITVGGQVHSLRNSASRINIPHQTSSRRLTDPIKTPPGSPRERCPTHPVTSPNRRNSGQNGTADARVEEKPHALEVETETGSAPEMGPDDQGPGQFDAVSRLQHRMLMCVPEVCHCRSFCAEAATEQEDHERERWPICHSFLRCCHEAGQLCWCCPTQETVRDWYNSPDVQITVAALIFINFVVNAADAQVNTTGEHQGVFNILELIFTVVFTVELCCNLYAHLWHEFWGDTWNWFDFVVVVISVSSLVLSGIPGVTVLRLLRAFRVFRLFKRLESLRKIIICIEAAIPGVANAFGILVLVMSIFAILGVEFFRNVDFGGTRYFGNFAASMLTLFQIMTGDSWAEAIARPCIEQYPLAAAYFILYILVSTIVLANIAIAVLLEKFVGVDNDTEADEDDFGPYELSFDERDEAPMLEMSHNETTATDGSLFTPSVGQSIEALDSSEETDGDPSPAPLPPSEAVEPASEVHEVSAAVDVEVQQKAPASAHSLTVPGGHGGNNKVGKHPDQKKQAKSSKSEDHLRHIDHKMTEVVQELGVLQQKLNSLDATQRLILELLQGQASRGELSVALQEPPSSGESCL